jgi:hypothetical protein
MDHLLGDDGGGTPGALFVKKEKKGESWHTPKQKKG